MLNEAVILLLPWLPSIVLLIYSIIDSGKELFIAVRT